MSFLLISTASNYPASEPSFIAKVFPLLVLIAVVGGVIWWRSKNGGFGPQGKAPALPDNRAAETSGDGWAYASATKQEPALWVGSDSILNITKALNGDKKSPKGAWLFTFMALFFMFGMGSRPDSAGMIGNTVGMLLALCAVVLWFIYWSAGSKWLGAQWKLAASGDGLTYQGALRWAVSFDEINRIESGQTVEWQKVREYNGKPDSIPDAEYQVFLFLDDGRRLVVHTANAAREDCGRLAHSIRSYVDAQRGNAAPSPSSSDTSSPAADGFDL